MQHVFRIPRPSLARAFRALVVLTLAALAPAAHAAKSHLLQKAERHVVLKDISSPGSVDCVRFPDQVLAEVAPDGTVATEEFVVPENHVLVVTEADWRVRDTPAGFVATRTLAFQIQVGGTPVFETGRITGGDLATSGVWVDSASLTTGFRVGPGARICPSASSVASGVVGLHEISSLILRGYLIRSK